MPLPQRRLSLGQVKDLIAASAAPAPNPDSSKRPCGVGLEVEVFAAQPHDEVSAALAPVRHWPGGSTLSFEPGGQVELSGPCLPGADAATDAVEADMAALAQAGVRTTAIGMHPAGGRDRVVDSPRYAAMEAFFDRDGCDGRVMMRDTAAFQVNVDCAADADRAWRAAHALGPVLLAAFANSPWASGRPTGWKSNRMRTWWGIDPTRTRPVGGSSMCGAWVAYALAARVMMLRLPDGRCVPGDGALTLAGWVEQGHDLGWPDEDDVAYHLTTLFPPVRPRGFLELRFLDGLPAAYRRVAAHAVSTLLDGADGTAAAEEACGQTADLWLAAARQGLGHPALADAAARCLAAVPQAAQMVEELTARRLCPGDVISPVVPAWA